MVVSYRARWSHARALRGPSLDTAKARSRHTRVRIRDRGVSMRRPRFLRPLGLASLVLAALAWPEEAEASGYLTARFGSDQGTPAQPNTFAVYFNPAALGGTKGTTLT